MRTGTYVISRTDLFLEEQSAKDHSGPMDDYREEVENWTPEMKEDAVAYLRSINEPDWAEWLRTETLE